MQIMSAVFTNTPGAAAAAEVRPRGSTGGQARAKGYRAWATLVVVLARSQSAPGAVESLYESRLVRGPEREDHHLALLRHEHRGRQRVLLRLEPDHLRC